MAKAKKAFMVTIEEVVHYTIEVKARTQDEAEADAMETLVQSENYAEFITGLEDRHVYLTLEK